MSLRLVSNFCVLGLAVLGFAGCSNAPADGECDKLLTHLVDLELNEAKVTDADRAAKDKVLRDAIGSKFIERCKTELPASQVKCGLTATSTTDFEKCD